MLEQYRQAVASETSAENADVPGMPSVQTDYSDSRSARSEDHLDETTTPEPTQMPAAAPVRRIVRVGARPIPPPTPSLPTPSPPTPSPPRAFRHAVPLSKWPAHLEALRALMTQSEEEAMKWDAQKPQSPSPEAGASRPAPAKLTRRLGITELVAKRAERLAAERAGAERLARARRGPAVETPATTLPRKVLSELEKSQRLRRILLARQARYAEALKSTTPELGGDEISPTPELGGDEISPTPELGGDEMSRVEEQQAAGFPEAVQGMIVGETALTEQSHFLGETSVYVMGAECEAQRGGDSAEDSGEPVGLFGRLKKFMWSAINAVKAVICP